MKQHQKKIIIILPTYNEIDNLKKIVQRVLSQESKSPGFRYEVVISDSSSPDGTGHLAKQMAKRNSRIHYVNAEKGLGYGLIRGFEFALKLNPDILAQLDADGQIDPAVLPKMVREIGHGCDLVIGSRFMKRSTYRMSKFRKFLGFCSSLVCRILIGPLDVSEFTASARAFTPELYKKLNFKKIHWREKTFIILPSFLNEALSISKKYKQLPITCNRRESSYSKNKIINYTYDILSYSIDCRLKKLGFNFPFFRWSRKLNFS